MVGGCGWGCGIGGCGRVVRWNGRWWARQDGNGKRELARELMVGSGT